jgi:hypothetical protein
MKPRSQGIASKNVNRRNAPKVELRSRAISPAAVNQLGNHFGSHVTGGGGRDTGYRGEQLFRGQGYSPPVGPTNNLLNGPKGQGRQVHARGYQAQHGAVDRGAPRIANTKGQWPDSKR